ncbi:nonsense-mediated mRNA decay factor SMG9-like [Pieris napi]|uniref:nonsense-mediated mRNA decay factor SMG9-like n=1 Tax=Pieris napi TaxID=78633 RepID=UPI001FB870B0|nr:nonsense-mediated mRNA decay factor SMG9-like [Pieris napi]
MSDKKKKVIMTKDVVSVATPKRPVILKSDRETKEQNKDKVEKEKQPTILIKTREQSTPKEERPVSPKSHVSDDTQQPCKIAQNEAKEKKEQKPCILKTMSEPVKLLDENLEFNNTALEYLNDNNSNYLIIGVIGMQGVGKSLILNLINQSMPIEDICHTILQSHEMPDTNEVDESIESHTEKLNIDKKQERPHFKFKMQDIEQIEKGVHCTKGVDMYVTSDRVILLDCQPLWSPCLIDTNLNAVTSRSANIVTVDCLQIASYLMAICHVLVAVQDWFCDYNFIRYIQAAEMLRPSLSSTNVNQESDSVQSEVHPHLLLLHNRCQLEDFTYSNVHTIQDFYRKAFQRSNLQLKSGMYLYSDISNNGVNVDSVNKWYSVEKCGHPINLFLLPEVYEDYDNKEIYRGHPTFEELAKRLRWMLLGVNRHQITNVPNLSEKGWFHFCNKAWESIKKCTFFLEYERFLP